MSNVALASSVLWLQGTALTQQPLEDSESIFCYNGDIFSGFDDSTQKNVGDTHLFHTFLKEQISSNGLFNLNKIHGPYAFIFFDKLNKKLYFGRDIFGRRSLLLGQNKEGDMLILTSVARRNTEFDFIEIPSVGIFCFDILNKKFEVEFWQSKNKNFYSRLKELEKFLKTEILISKHSSETECIITHDFNENDNLILLKNIKCNDEINNIFNVLLNCDTWMHNLNLLKESLEEAVCKRISTQPEFCKKCIKTRLKCNHATTGILFSGII